MNWLDVVIVLTIAWFALTGSWAKQKYDFNRDAGLLVTPDGQTFVLIERIDPDIGSITLIQNWAATPSVLRNTGGTR